MVEVVGATKTEVLVGVTDGWMKTPGASEVEEITTGVVLATVVEGSMVIVVVMATVSVTISHSVS